MHHEDAGPRLVPHTSSSALQQRPSFVGSGPFFCSSPPLFSSPFSCSSAVFLKTPENDRPGKPLPFDVGMLSSEHARQLPSSITPVAVARLPQGFEALLTIGAASATPYDCATAQ
jgi:hypothetical protein